MSDVSDNYTLVLDESMMDASREQQMYNKLSEAMPDFAKLMLISNDMVLLESKMSSDLKQPRFILEAVVITGVVIGMAGMYQAAIDANNKRAQIIIKAIANASAEDLKGFNHDLRIDPNSTKAEALKKVNSLGFREMEAMSTRMSATIRNQVANGTDEKYATQLKTHSVNTAKELGLVAVTTVVGQYLNVLGGQGVDKVISGTARILGASAQTAALMGAGVDLIVSGASKQPLDLLAKHLTIVQKSKDTFNENIEASKKTLLESVDIIQKIATNSLPEGVKMQDIVDAANAIMKNIAIKSGQGSEKADGSVVVKIPYRATITTAKNVKDGDTIIVPESDESDIIIIADGKVPEVIIGKNVVGSIVIEIVLEEVVVGKNMTLSATAISSTADSITYKVTANIIGINSKTTISAAAVNGSLLSAKSQNLSSNGTLSWTVEVFSQDATINISRSDDSAVYSIGLDGIGDMGNYDGSYHGTWTTEKITINYPASSVNCNNPNTNFKYIKVKNGKLYEVSAFWDTWWANVNNGNIIEANNYNVNGTISGNYMTFREIHTMVGSKAPCIYTFSGYRQ